MLTCTTVIWTPFANLDFRRVRAGLGGWPLVLLVCFVVVAGCRPEGDRGRDVDDSVSAALPVAAAPPPAAPGGLVYPIDRVVPNDANFAACGRSYFTDIRHTGADILASVGTPVYAVDEGTVLAISGPGASAGWGQGNYGVAVLHQSSAGAFVAFYGHINQLGVGVGSTVVAGQRLGNIGSYPTPHLHFGVRPGSTVPAAGWGRVSDPGCLRPWELNGFVAPISYLVANCRATCASPNQPPIVGPSRETSTGEAREVFVEYADPEGTAPTSKKITYEYVDLDGVRQSRVAYLSHHSGRVDDGEYRWAATVRGNDLRFYFEFRDGAGATTRFPASGWKVARATAIPSLQGVTAGSGSPVVTTRNVELSLLVGAAPTHYMASEDSSFAGASWLPFDPSPVFLLSPGVGPKRVCARVKTADGSSQTQCDSVTLAAAGDFVGNLRSDAVWAGPAGDLAVWDLDGPTLAGWQPMVGYSLDHELVCAADFDQNGTADLLFRHQTTSEITIRTFVGTVITGWYSVGMSDMNWDIVACGDLTGDGSPELLFRENVGTRRLSAWIMHGPIYGGSVDLGPTSPDARLVGVGEFVYLDGHNDILWEVPFAPAGGELWLWHMTGLTLANSVKLADYNNAWEVVSVGDHNGDGWADLLWQESGVYNTLWRWGLVNLSIVDNNMVNSTDPNWRIAAP
jgi:hypothetical protein